MLRNKALEINFLKTTITCTFNRRNLQRKADLPNRLRVSDLTRTATCARFANVVFLIDAFASQVGWLAP